jgi:hypothetical protein
MIAAAAVAVTTAIAASLAAPPHSPPPDASAIAAPPPSIEIAQLAEANLAAADLPPGSVIRLLRGVHRPLRLEGLRGSAEQPIRILSEGSGEVAMIAGGEIGLELRDCRHVVVERLGLIGAAAAAIRIEGGEAIELRELLLARMSRHSPSIGIEAIGVRGLRAEAIRIDGWSEAAISLDRVDSARIDKVELLAMREWPNRVGLRVGPGCERIEAVALHSRGVPRPVVVDGGDAPPRGVEIRESLLIGAAQAFTIGSGRAVAVRRNSILEPRVAYSIEPLPAGEGAAGGEPARDAEFAGNIVAWAPGAMAAWSRLADGAEPRGFRLGENWWWSEELPEAIPLLGERFAESAEPQRFGGDPRLDEGGIPQRGEAASFGRTPR